jgi:ABC-type transport system involved in cytochrome bd biosynthesis fused ATPase/permease subunit
MKNNDTNMQYYKYRGNIFQVLKSFNMNVRSGETVALVGPSGCGKSTAVNLVQRFYDPDKGSVSLNIFV